jgi:putative Holliday junction resolvase
MGRIMALDYGMKRTGVAVTDPMQIIVNPLDVVATIDLFEFLLRYIETECVEKIVIGQPSNIDGTPTYIEPNIQKLISSLKQNFPNLLIARQDESLTSSHAKELLVKMGLKKKKRQEKGMLDKISSVLILQRYLNHI